MSFAIHSQKVQMSISLIVIPANGRNVNGTCSNFIAVNRSMRNPAPNKIDPYNQAPLFARYNQDIRPANSPVVKTTNSKIDPAGLPEVRTAISLVSSRDI